MVVPLNDLLVDNLSYAFDISAWHGTTLLGSLRGLSQEQADWRPATDRKSIGELILHAAYWKYCVRRWLTGAEAKSFGRSPADWPKPGAIKEDIAFLEEEHRMLREAVAAFDVSRLSERATEKGPTWQALILGVAAHDTHHTGQIQLLKRLQAEV